MDGFLLSRADYPRISWLKPREVQSYYKLVVTAFRTPNDIREIVSWGLSTDGEYIYEQIAPTGITHVSNSISILFPENGHYLIFY